LLTHKTLSPVNPKRVLILGAGGFLAPEILRVLTENGVAVRAIGSKQIDLTEPDASNKLAREISAEDVVIMAAALTPDKGRDIATLMKNLKMAENVCGALGHSKPSAFIYISSDGVYDARFSSLLSEESTCEPMDLYCLAHVAREKMLDATCRAAEIPLTLVRPCAIYGAGDTHNSYGPNRFIRMAHKDGKIKIFGGGEEKRHHVYVRDVAQIVYLCVVHGSTGIINAVTGDPITFGEVAEQIATLAGPTVTVENLPRGGPITHRCFDTTALTKAFPNFESTPFEKGLASTFSETAKA
jgi:nucleoside-diphosphate-sugar epimerase